MLILTDFDSFADTYLRSAGCFKNFIYLQTQECGASFQVAIFVEYFVERFLL